MSKNNQKEKELDDNLAKMMRSLKTDDARDQIIDTVRRSKDVDEVVIDICKKELKIFDFQKVLLKSLKTDTVQKEIFLASVKGAFLKSYGFLIAVLVTVWIGNSIPSIQQIISSFSKGG